MNALHPHYAAVIDQLGIDDHDRLLTYIKPAMYASFERRASEFPLGASRFGGLPDLPSVLAWPTCDAGSLPFVAQVNLSELPNSPRRELLPPAGMLYFFYGKPIERLHFPDDDPASGGAAVLYAADMGSLSRAEPPDGLTEADVSMESPQLLRFHPCNTFPESDDPVWQRHGLREGPDVDVPGLEWPFNGRTCGDFQMLGHATPMQWSVCREVLEEPGEDATPQEREAYIESASNLETLFQAVDAVGDCTLYFLIARDDLVARRWDRTHWTIQCT